MNAIDRFIFSGKVLPIGVIREYKQVGDTPPANLPPSVVDSILSWGSGYYYMVSLGNGVELYLPGGRCHEDDVKLMERLLN